MVTQDTVNSLADITAHLREAKKLARTLPHNEERLYVVHLLLGHLLTFVEERYHVVGTRVQFQEQGLEA